MSHFVNGVRHFEELVPQRLKELAHNQSFTEINAFRLRTDWFGQPLGSDLVLTNGKRTLVSSVHVGQEAHKDLTYRTAFFSASCTHSTSGRLPLCVCLSLDSSRTKTPV